jgi:hypothetical protein
MIRNTGRAALSVPIIASSKFAEMAKAASCAEWKREAERAEWGRALHNHAADRLKKIHPGRVQKGREEQNTFPPIRRIDSSRMKKGICSRISICSQFVQVSGTMIAYL